MSGLKSFLAGQFREYIEFRISLGYSKRSLEERTATLDRFLNERFPGEMTLSQDMINIWAERRQKEKLNGKRARLSTTSTFLKYLKEQGCCDVHVPAEAIPKNQHFNPFILSDKNLADIFLAADTMPVCRYCPNREYVLPVMLRMMYCCALRPGEPFRLLQGDVDFSNGTIFIRQSKKNKDRIVWMSEELFNLCKSYDGICGDRPFFFTSPSSGRYGPSWLRSQFKICLEKAGIYGENPRPRPYDLRHAATSRIVLRWLGEGIDQVEMLYRLKVHLGHDRLDDTLWYLHTLPNNLVRDSNVDWSSLDDVYPAREVKTHEED